MLVTDSTINTTRVGSQWRSTFTFTAEVADEDLRRITRPSFLLGLAGRARARSASNIKLHIESQDAADRRPLRLRLSNGLDTIVVGTRLLPDPSNRSALFGALEAQAAAIEGRSEVIDSFARVWLGIPAAKTAEWRDAVALALIGDWIGALSNVRITDDSIATLLRDEARVAHRQLQPLWKRKVGGKRLCLLDKPVNDGFLRDLVTDGSGPELSVLRTVLDDLRLTAVLDALAPQERAVARAWAYGGAPTWKEAARRVGADDPAAFGERVRRKLQRRGAEYLRRRPAGTKSGLWLPGIKGGRP